MRTMEWSNWSGVVCCFVLFILVFIGYRFGLSYGNPLQGHFNPGLLIFLLPGVIASIVSCRSPLGKPLLGALLAGFPCFAMILLWCPLKQSFWQDIALVLSGVFWSALGALCWLFFLKGCKHLIAAKLPDK